MKRILLLLMCLVFFSGCSSGQAALDAGHRLRSNILDAEGCSFTASITADYGDEIYNFDMHCTFDNNGALSFSVMKPDSIAGITGTVDATEGALTFDDQVLAFQMLADGQITPVSAPWVLMKAIRGGYIAACSKEKNGFYLQLDDSYEEDPLTVDLWIDENCAVTRGEFLWDGRRIISIDVSDFKLL